MIERIQGVGLALVGLAAAFGMLLYGPWRPDAGTLLRDVCGRYQVCATQTLRAVARDLVWSGEPGALEEAIAINRHLVRGDPAEPENWAALGEAFSVAGDTKEAEIAFAAAVELGPNRPDILMRAVNWALESGRADLAVSLARRQLALVRDYDQVVFRLLRLSGLTSDEILTQVIPGEREPLAAYLRYLNAAGDAEGAEATWRRMAELDLLQAGDLPAYVALMLKAGRYEEAVRAQQVHAGSGAAEWPERNLVFNGGFEADSLDTALDWRIAAHQNVDVAIDDAVRVSGTRSLRIAFLGRENVRFSHVTQTVLLRPGAEYRLEAQVRSEGVTTDEGLRIELRGRAGDGSSFTAATDPILGGHDWRPLSLAFRAPAGLEQADVIFTRRPSRKFESKIHGKVWIDDVRLEGRVRGRAAAFRQPPPLHAPSQSENPAMR